MKWRVASLQLSDKNHQLPAVLIGQIDTLTWRKCSKGVRSENMTYICCVCVCGGGGGGGGVH